MNAPSTPTGGWLGKISPMQAIDKRLANATISAGDEPKGEMPQALRRRPGCRPCAEPLFITATVGFRTAFTNCGAPEGQRKPVRALSDSRGRPRRSGSPEHASSCSKLQVRSKSEVQELVGAFMYGKYTQARSETLDHEPDALAILGRVFFLELKRPRSGGSWGRSRAVRGARAHLLNVWRDEGQRGAGSAAACRPGKRWSDACLSAT